MSEFRHISSGLREALEPAIAKAPEWARVELQGILGIAPEPVTRTRPELDQKSEKETEENG